MVPATVRRTVVEEVRAPAALGPYSHAIATGGLVFCSGQLPIDPSTGAIVGDSAGAQTEQCLRNLEAICEQAGTSLSRSARLTLYLTDLEDFEEVNAVNSGFFDGSPRRGSRCKPRPSSAGPGSRSTRSSCSDRADMKIAEQRVSVLAQSGVERVYGVVGDSMNPVVDAIRRTPG